MERRKKTHLRRQTDERDAHRETDHAEHVGDLHVAAGSQHVDGNRRLVVDGAVDDNDDHHRDQDVVTRLRGKRNRTWNDWEKGCPTP